MAQVVFDSPVSTLWVFGTGGTISGRSADPSDILAYTAGEVSIADLLADVALPTVPQVRAVQVAQIDSKDMSWSLWRELLAMLTLCLHDPNTVGAVITHGTDTMEETAYFLHLALGRATARKPVVLTGAMRPASAPQPDGPGNIADAMALACSPGARGVMMLMAGAVWDAVQGQKLYSGRVDAFGARDADALAWFVQGHLSLRSAWPAVPDTTELTGLRLDAPWVEVLCSMAQADGRAVRALVQAGVAGLVIATTGNGTVHSAMQDALEAALKAGVAVVRASRTAHGHIRDGRTQTIPSAGALSPYKARVALMLALVQGRKTI